MSYGIEGYLLTAGKLQALYGSHDAALEQRSLSFQDPDAAHLGTTPWPECLCNILAGTIPQDHFANHEPGYAIALRRLCQWLGTMLPNDTMMPSGLDIIPMVPELYTTIYGGVSVLPIPFSYDFPAVGFIAQNEMAAKIERHKNLDPDQVDVAARLRSQPTPAELVQWRKDIAAIAGQYRSWLEQAQATQGEIVLFLL